MARVPRLGAGDVIAGVSVALVLIPQALAYAELAGLPAYRGLYAAILPPIAAALFASSPYLQTGPVAITGLLTLAALTALSTPGRPEYAGLAALLAIVVGVTRLILGLVKGGWLAYLMSGPVIGGFTAGAALLIVGSQVPAAVGVSVDADVAARLWTAIAYPERWDPYALGLAVLTMGVVLGGRRIHAMFPGVLVAVVVGLVASRVVGYAGPVVGAVPSGLPPVSLALPWGDLPQLLVPGLVIALVGFAEPSAIARTYATLDRSIWSPDREFISQGVANLAAGISGAFPVGGSFSRTALTRMAGARTRLAGGVTGLAVLAFLPFAGIVSPLPRAVLAAIVIASVLKLVTLRRLLELRRYSVPQAAIGWATFGLTLVLAPRVEQAVLVGIALAILAHLWREQRVHIDAHYDATSQTLTLAPRGVLFFGSASALDRALVDDLAAYPLAACLVLDLHRLGRIDYTGAEALKRLAEDAHQAGLEVAVRNVPPHTGGLLPRVFGEQSPFLERTTR